MNSLSDEEILRRIALGDEEALGMLYDRFGKVAFALACRVLEDGGTAEDVVQEAFVKIWRRAPSFDGSRGNARTWILAIVHHQAIDVCRSRRSLPATQATYDVEWLSSDAEHVWHAVAARADQETIKKALASLPDEQRQAIEMAYFGGYTHREISERLAVPLGTVKGRIRIGMEKLRDLLMDQRLELK